MVFDVNAVAKQKLWANPRRKFSLPELNYNRKITMTIIRLRTKHFKVYENPARQLKNICGVQAFPAHSTGFQTTFGCHSIIRALFKIDINYNTNTLYIEKAEVDWLWDLGL